MDNDDRLRLKWFKNTLNTIEKHLRQPFLHSERFYVEKYKRYKNLIFKLQLNLKRGYSLRKLKNKQGGKLWK